MRTSGPDILHNSKFEIILEIILSEYTFDKSVRFKLVEIIVDLFLKLLVAQMKNQDPFNSQDPTQYITQLAQFNTNNQVKPVAF